MKVIGVKMNDNEESSLRDTLLKLRNEHREIDKEISSVQTTAGADSLEIQRLKKKKLSIKDKIKQLEDQLLPDIIA